jgi:hypothetical protein
MSEKQFYIVCPASVVTGGPELLHQVCKNLTDMGYKAKMLYYGNLETYESIVPHVYIGYHNDYTVTAIDDENAVFIIPEVATDFVEYCKKGQMIIWWLSVDNYFGAQGYREADEKYLKLKEKINLWEGRNIIHLAQSYYAIEFLKNLKVASEKIFYLSDYLRSEFFLETQTNREHYDYVLYNPAKGAEFVAKLMAKAPELEWKALKGLTPQEMVNVLRGGKIYIDFGRHPGKDRIPREAAINGCCVITNRKGSANYYEDVPIPDEYKFGDERIDDIIQKIKEIIQDYPKHNQNFEAYREFIRNEELNFKKDVYNIFTNLYELPAEKGTVNNELNLQASTEHYLNIYNQLLQLEKEDSSVIQEEIIKYQKEFEISYETYIDIIKFYRLNAEIVFNRLAMMFLKAGLLKLIIPLLSTAFDRNPQNITTNYNLAYVLYVLKEYKLAFDYLSKIRHLDAKALNLAKLIAAEEINNLS